jgi:lysophospholipase L1-like esterase
MTKNKLLVLLAVALVGSTAVNLVLALAVRSLYIEAKVEATQPNLATYEDANAELQAEPGGARRLVLFGDSRVAQWHPLPEVGMSWRILNRGVSGETTAQMRWRFPSDVLDLQPDAVLIQAGINDLVAASLAGPERRATIVQRCILNLQSLIDQAGANDIHVILLSVFPPAPPPLYRLPVWDESILVLVDEVNGALRRMSFEPHVRWIDSAAALMQPNGVWRQDASKDTLHLTAAGYGLLNDVVEPVLERLGDAVQ